MKIYFEDLQASSKTIDVNFGDGEFHTYNISDIVSNGNSIDIPNTVTDYSKIVVRGNSTILSNLDVLKKIAIKNNNNNNLDDKPYLIYNKMGDINILYSYNYFQKNIFEKGILYIACNLNMEDGTVNKYNVYNAITISETCPYYIVPVDNSWVKDSIKQGVKIYSWYQVFMLSNHSATTTAPMGNENILYIE